MFLLKNMVSTGLLVFFFCELISAETYPTIRNKFNTDIYLSVDPGNIKLVVNFESTVVFSLISNTSDISKMKYYCNVESVRITIRNLENGQIINHDTCSSLSDVEADIMIPFYANYEYGLFKSVQAYKNQSNVGIDIILRLAQLLQVNLRDIAADEVETTKEVILDGPCTVKLHHLKTIPLSQGLIYEFSKSWDMSTCTNSTNQQIKIDESCNPDSQNDNKWTFTQHAGGLMNTPLTAVTSSKSIDEESFKPWKGSSETIDKLAILTSFGVNNFHAPINFNIKEEDTKIVYLLPQREINIDLIQDKQSNGLKKLYRGLACNNLVYENVYLYFTQMAIACELDS